MIYILLFLFIIFTYHFYLLFLFILINQSIYSTFVNFESRLTKLEDMIDLIKTQSVSSQRAGEIKNQVRDIKNEFLAQTKGVGEVLSTYKQSYAEDNVYMENMGNTGNVGNSGNVGNTGNVGNFVYTNDGEDVQDYYREDDYAASNVNPDNNNSNNNSRSNHTNQSNQSNQSNRKQYDPEEHINEMEKMQIQQINAYSATGNNYAGIEGDDES